MAVALPPDMASVERLARKMDSELASVDDKIRDFLTVLRDTQSRLAAFRSMKVPPSIKGSPLNRVNKASRALNSTRHSIE